MRRPALVAISGVKNSGKTTLICELIRILSLKELKVAVIKHDGHDFDPDVPGSDTWRQFHAGACGTVVFSASKSMVVKQNPGCTAEDFVACFPEADLIFLEGFKDSGYPKIELVRAGNSDRSVCDPEYLLAIATNLPERDLKRPDKRIPLLPLDKPETVAEFIMQNLTLISEGRNTEG